MVSSFVFVERDAGFLAYSFVSGSMSQGRISYSRVLVIGVVVFTLVAGGYWLGRVSNFAPQQIAGSHDSAVQGKRSVQPIVALPRGERQMRDRWTLALDNLTTIVSVQGQPHLVALPSDERQMRDRLALALRSLTTIVPVRDRPHPVTNVAKSDVQPVHLATARLHLALRNAVSIIPPLKNHERITDIVKSEFTIGVSESVPAMDEVGISSVHMVTPFVSPDAVFWSKFGQPVWYGQPPSLGLEMEGALSSTERTTPHYFGGLTEREFRTREVRCLAKAIYHEARGESQKGQFAVAQTIMNRVRTSFFPDTICGVIYENSHRRNQCQFSFACDGISDKPKDTKLWEVALENARQVAAGKIWLDDVGYASHYHATYVRPVWRKYMNKIKRIGIHIFYRAKFLPMPEEVALRNSKGNGVEPRAVHAINTRGEALQNN